MTMRRRKLPNTAPRILVILVLLAIYPMALAATPACPQCERLETPLQDLKRDILASATELNLLQAAAAASAEEQPKPREAILKLKQAPIAPFSLEDARASQEQGELFAAISKFQTGRRLNRIGQDADTALTLANLYLDYGLLDEAERILNQHADNPVPATYARIVYYFGKLHYQRREWPQALQRFEDVTLDILGHEQDELLLLRGITLQHLKRYRDATAALEQIPNDSPLALYAQFNLALANLRQGWWSDGEQTIERLATQLDDTHLEDKALSDRFYTTLGFSQLEREFFRQARDAFRNVSLDGRYSNRAMLGLILAAMEQGDYQQALRLTSLLKQKDARALEVDEAHLLTPYLLDKLEQDQKAATAYQESVVYFQQRAAEIDTLLVAVEREHSGIHLPAAALDIAATPREPAQQTALNQGLAMVDDQTRSAIGVYYLALFEAQQHLDSLALRLDALRATQVDRTGIAAIESAIAESRRRIDELMLTLNAAAKAPVMDGLRRRQEHLKSYVSQAKFGLANLYDNAATAQVQP